LERLNQPKMTFTLLADATVVPAAGDSASTPKDSPLVLLGRFRLFDVAQFATGFGERCLGCGQGQM
jgi:hypothetical protein